MMDPLKPMTITPPKAYNQMGFSAPGSAPRFGLAHGATPLMQEVGQAAQQDWFYRLSNQFLTMAPKVEKLNPLGFLRRLPGGETVNNLAKGFLTRLADHDYREVASPGIFGRVLVEPPQGALFAILYLFTISGRLKHALNRAVGGDSRELRDIMIRDIPSITIFLYGLNPAMNAMSKGLEKMGGLRLSPKGVFNSYKYFQLDEMYTVHGPNQLQAMMADGFNEKGVAKAIAGVRRNKFLNGEPQFQNVLTQFEEALMKGFKITKSAGFDAANPAHLAQLDVHAKQAFQHLNFLEGMRQTAFLEPTHKLESAMGSNVFKRTISRFRGGIESVIPSFRKMFTTHAQMGRVGVSAFGYAIIIGLLGYGVTAFNKWYTEREYAQLVNANMKNGGGAADSMK